MDEHRGVPRRRAFKGAQIIFNGGASAIDCTLSDISLTGARLKVVTPVGVPDRFTLLILADGVRHECRVAWKRANDIGVSFMTGLPDSSKG